MRLGGSYTHAWTRPDLAGLPIKSTTQIVSLFASYPVTLTQAHQLTVGGGLDVIDQDIGLGGIPLNRDRLRVLTLHADADWIDAGSHSGRGGYSPAEPPWSLATSLEARRGRKTRGPTEQFRPAGTGG